MMMGMTPNMMDALIAIINVKNYVHNVKKEFVMNVMFLGGLLKKMFAYHFVGMELLLGMNNVMI